MGDDDHVMGDDDHVAAVLLALPGVGHVGQGRRSMSIRSGLAMAWFMHSGGPA
jgi:hypothetical protein